MFKTIIELQEFGDIVLSTRCIMVSDETLNVDIIIKNFCTLNDIPSIEGLPDNKLKYYTDEFEKYLLSIRFRLLNTNKVYMCD